MVHFFYENYFAFPKKIATGGHSWVITPVTHLQKAKLNLKMSLSEFLEILRNRQLNCKHKFAA